MSVSVALPRAKTPEEVGVSSEKLLDVLRELEKTDYHGFMVIRHGKIAAEWFRAPYTATSPHAMYSVSKSISAIAVGYAVTEGIMSLDDKVVDYFPEHVPKKCDDNLKKITLKHLITLTAGRDVSPLKNKTKNDWIDIFMQSKSSYEPGDKFSYINENFHMALAMLQKATGMTTVQFLTPRLFEPLGINVPFWESDNKGIEAGGWGIYLSVNDLAKISLCFMNGGVFEGKQIIPAQWVAESKVSHKGPHARVQNNQDFGYGYGLWISQGEDPPYRFDGFFGQVAEMHEKYDALTIIIGGDIKAAARDVIFKAFPGGFIDEKADALPNEELQSEISQIGFKPLPSAERSELESKINGRRITFAKKHFLNLLNFQLSVLPAAATYMAGDKAGNITDVVFDFKSDCVTFSWREGDESNSIDCGLDGEWRASKMRLGGQPLTAYSSAAWTDKNTLILTIRPQEIVCSRNLIFTFSDNRVKMKPSSDPPIDTILDGVKGPVRSFIKSESLTDKLMEWGKNSVEPIHKGKFV